MQNTRTKRTNCWIQQQVDGIRAIIPARLRKKDGINKLPSSHRFVVGDFY